MERLPDFIRTRLRQLAQSKPRWRKSTKLCCRTTQRATRAEGTHSIELFKPDGEGAGLEEILDRHDNLTVARAIYRVGLPSSGGSWSCCATAAAFW
jgi:hypothetical protein